MRHGEVSRDSADENERHMRYQFAARLIGDHVVCAVADCSNQMLKDLIKSVQPSG